MTTSIARLLPLFALAGCISTAEDEGPCPCAAPLRCCVAVDRCLPADSPCFAAPVDYTLTINADALDPAGGTEVLIELDPPAEIRAVTIGATPCAPLDTTPYRCVAPGWQGIRAAVDVEVHIGPLDDPRVLTFEDAARYALPDFVVWPGAPLPPAHAAAVGADGLLLATVDGAPTQAPTPPVLAMSEALPLDPLVDLELDDLDRDGILDLFGVPFEAPPIKAGADGTDARLWLRDGLANATLRGVLFDLDGDGYSDFIGHTEVRGPLGIERAPITALGGAGGFTVDPALGLPALIFERPVRDYALVDHDVDGDIDLLVCGDALWLVVFEDGAVADVFATAPPPAPCGAMAVLDVNRDGRPDVVWTPALDYAATDTREAQSGTYILRNEPLGFVLATPQATIDDPTCTINRAADSTLSLGRSKLAAFDVDLDGDIDLFMPAPYSRCAGRLVWYENAGDRFILRPVDGADADPQPTSVLPADLDGDGDLDVIVTAAPPHRSRVWRNLRVERGPAQALVVRPTSPDAHSVRGARVSLITDERVLVRVLGTRNSGDALEAHFGLGDTEPPWLGVVRWPDGVEALFEADRPGLVEVPRP